MSSTLFMVIVYAGIFGSALGVAWTPKEILSDDVNVTVCLLEVAEPEQLILDPNSFASLDQFCDEGYLEECFPIFVSNCETNNATCTNETNYIEWMTAYQNGSQTYICNKTLQEFNDTANNDGCSSYTFKQIDAALYNMMLVAYYGNTTDCGKMEDVFNTVLLSLNGCNNLNLFDEFNDYFQTIVAVSPCAGQIELTGPLNASSCYKEVYWPEDLMLNPFDFDTTDITPICSDSYMDDCLPIFESTCGGHPKTCTDENNYLEWMSAYRNGSQAYVCAHTLQKFKDEYNSDCTYNSFEPLALSLINLMKVVYFGNTTDCSAMEYVFNDVLHVLSGCDDGLGLTGEFKDYFQAIVDVSPCDDKIVLSASTTHVANMAVTIATLAVALFTTFHGRL